jgi:hypothetical protein
VTAALFLFGLYQVLTTRQLFLAAVLLYATIWPYATIISRQMLAMGFLFFVICYGLKNHLANRFLIFGILLATLFHMSALFIYAIIYLVSSFEKRSFNYERFNKAIILILISLVAAVLFYSDYTYVERGYGLMSGLLKFLLQFLIILPFILFALGYLKMPQIYTFFRFSIIIPFFQLLSAYSQASERLMIFFYCFLVILSVKVLWEIESVELKLILFMYMFLFFVLYRGIYAQI